jgi:hypothetical protein
MDFTIEYGTGCLRRLDSGILPWKVDTPKVSPAGEQLVIAEGLEDW